MSPIFFIMIYLFMCIDSWVIQNDQ